MSVDGIRKAKQQIREEIWGVLDAEGAVATSAAGRIPAFLGSDAAAVLLAEHPAWKSSRIIKAVPDRAQMPVREVALREGKSVYMAAPKLAAEKPFYFLDPQALAIPPHEAAERRTAAQHATLVDLAEMPPIDLIVCGSVAVNRQGARLGKGAGYADVEVALLQEAGLIGSSTLIATTVHELQVIDAVIPESSHDFRVDLIITPRRIIECPPHERPQGIFWDSLSPEMIAEIPALAKRER
ncbi:5-formyltetrahydrofolate cyclo-ligase [Streptomyces niveiscabiei]|uniref:5-formyltetrahydrofolate cyclo-ligase n=1 Tax=Streptomyces niveiscabiei TaxID=164115 RepID=UPI0029B26D12|nr:5-formyltetrahydrofolate cyclo-ligase [Streptomyces niveiscabiei]MDX3380695.1 5-formyltetrahydrofolate cyclo-ligase [Streptomyces niveiscabiei]